MRLCNNGFFAILFAGAALTLGAQPFEGTDAAELAALALSAVLALQTSQPDQLRAPCSLFRRSANSAAPRQSNRHRPAFDQAPPLTVDRIPCVRRMGSRRPGAGPLKKEGTTGYVLHTDVEEVVLNATVLEGTKLVPDLKKDDFQVFEDGVKQTILSFQHSDLPVSIALVVDNSGSMSRKRPAVNKSTLDLIQASNPQDEAFVVNFSDEAFIDQEFTSDVNKLRDGLAHIESRGRHGALRRGGGLGGQAGGRRQAAQAGADSHHRRRRQCVDAEPGADDSPRAGAVRAGRFIRLGCCSATR